MDPIRRIAPILDLKERVEVQWAEVSITIDKAGVEAVANLFHEMGAGGVVIEDPELIRQYRTSGKWEYEDLPLVGPETGTVVRGYLAVDSSLPERLAQIQGLVNRIGLALPGVEGKVEFRRLEEENWAGSWKKHYRTMELGNKLVIKPAWEDYTPSREQVVIEIDPGMAFGTGTHPSTTLCLMALEELIAGQERVFDIGTGSGILAVAAAKLGAREVIGIDCDPVAVKCAAANVALNRVENRVTIVQGDLLTGVVSKAHLITANITADVIMDLTSHLRDHLFGGGRVILGGIISHRLPEVQEKLEEAGLFIQEARSEGDWITLVAARE